MKDTRAGGGAFSCNPLVISALRRAVNNFYIEVNFFGQEKSPLHAREITKALKLY